MDDAVVDMVVVAEVAEVAEELLKLELEPEFEVEESGKRPTVVFCTSGVPTPILAAIPGLAIELVMLMLTVGDVFPAYAMLDDPVPPNNENIPE